MFSFIVAFKARPHSSDHSQNNVEINFENAVKEEKMCRCVDVTTLAGVVIVCDCDGHCTAPFNIETYPEFRRFIF